MRCATTDWPLSSGALPWLSEGLIIGALVRRDFALAVTGAYCCCPRQSVWMVFLELCCPWELSGNSTTRGARTQHVFSWWWEALAGLGTLAELQASALL